MRLLLVALFAAVVASQKAGLKLSKGQTPNCVDVLGNFTQYRDTCLEGLGLAEWTVFPTPAPPTPPPATSTPTQTPAPTSSTGTPTTGSPVTDTPTGTPTSVTGAPSTGAPSTVPPPTPSPAEAACAPAGPCRSFVNNAEMWRAQIDWCLREAAEEQTEEMAEQTTSELMYALTLVNKGCSKNEMGDFCSDGAFAALQEGGCPSVQADVDGWVESYGCCVASYAELSMARAELMTDPTTCEGEFEIGKACKAPKWKLPKKEAAPASKGLAKKGKIAGAVVGGVAGLGLVGFALRKRRNSSRSASKPQKATGQVAMVSVPVAV